MLTVVVEFVLFGRNVGLKERDGGLTCAFAIYSDIENLIYIILRVVVAIVC